MREILAQLAAPPIFVFSNRDAVADGSRSFHVYCDAYIDGLVLRMNRSSRTAQCDPSPTSAALPSIPRGTRLRSTLTLVALSGLSNAFEATSGARSFASSRITRRSKASAKWEATTRESSSGSCLSPRSTTPSSTARSEPTEKPISCHVSRVCHGTRSQWI